MAQKQNKGPAEELAKRTTAGCSCKKTKCSKLYCECLASSRACGEECRCLDCENKTEAQHLRESAFEPLQRRPSERGCHCKKSGCLKKYCECFNSGRGCTAECRCEECRNREGEHLPEPPKRKRAKGLPELLQLMQELEADQEEQEMVLDLLIQVLSES